MNKRKSGDLLELKVFLILALVVGLLFLFLSYISIPVNSVIGTPNATVRTYLEVGNAFPEILNVSIDDNAATVTLTPNSTKQVRCVALLRDYNNDSDIYNVTATFFDNIVSTYTGSNDNNNHYFNASCFINRTFGSWMAVNDDEYLALANCTFELWYYSNSSEWNCTVFVNDTISWNATKSDNITVNELLAVWLPDTINYGSVSALAFSEENITNVSNAGNVKINLSLSGYGRYEGDGNAMNCTYGSIKNISVDYERYNLSAATSSISDLDQFNGLYINLTSAPVVNKYELSYRIDDSNNDATNRTYWRIYVPIGVAGNCSGSIIFGATKAVGS